ncbi:MAG: bifunctional nuclease family protein [Odoribacter sp.]|nr:bifunctional nuclease family protein [Odoribacter sp.]
MDRVKLKVLGLSYSMSQTGAYALILANEKDTYRIPIVIGTPEAQSIAIQLEQLQIQRPLTHDLIKKLTDNLDVQLKEVMIYRLEAGIFYSELLFETPTKMVKIDSRTSDAIALALCYGCDIYTTPEIIEKAGILVNEEVREQQGEIHDNVINVEENQAKDYGIQELKKLMDEAISREDYEMASKYRDILKTKNAL